MFLRTGRSIVKSKVGDRVISIPPTRDYTYPGEVLLASYGGGNFTHHKEIESIAYTVRDPARPGAANYCVHKHDVSDYPYSGPISVLHHTPGSPTQRTDDTSYVNWMTSAHDVGVAAAKSAFGVNLREAYLGVNGGSLIRSGFERMKPDLTEVSLPNFLWDLGQISSLFRLWNSRKSVVSNLGNANLNYGFGWKPTVSDVSAIVSSVVNLHQKLKDWNDSLGKIVTKRATVYDYAVSKSGAVAGQPHTRFTTNWRGVLQQRVTAHLSYRPSPLKAMTNTEKLLKGFLDSLGFELNPAIIWDAVPFSFIVDWFLPIGNILESLKLDTLELPFIFEDSYLQYKELALFDTWIKDNGDGNYPARAFPGSMSTEKFFQRMLILPRIEDIFAMGWKLPSLRQISYGISLGLK